jgi:transcription factor IIIB 90 kDa subunit
MNQAKTILGHLNTQLSLNDRCVDGALRWFRLAAQRNFTQGRRIQTVVAACLYIVCRREKKPRMLIDFSDALNHRDVYELGHAYLRLRYVLQLHLPVIEPELFLRRFVAKLEFGEQHNEVYNTATRIVAMMRRDWIQTGRRPSGICGAALLIASRLHGFRRTQKEIVRVVRVCEFTLKQRLDEFIATPVADLTAEEFTAGTIESLALKVAAPRDPPSFATARGNAQKQQKASEKSERKEAEDDDDNEEIDYDGEEYKRTRDKEARAIEELLDNEMPDDDDDDELFDDGDDATKSKEKKEKRSGNDDDDVDTDGFESDSSDSDDSDDDEAERQRLMRRRGLPAPLIQPEKEIVIADGALSVEAAVQQMAGLVGDEGDEVSLSDLDDGELDCYLNTEVEANAKKIIWEKLNQEYVDRQAAKRAAQGTRAPNPPKKRQRTHVMTRAAGSAAEGDLERAKNRQSDKINYKALSAIVKKKSAPSVRQLANLGHTPGGRDRVGSQRGRKAVDKAANDEAGNDGKSKNNDDSDDDDNTDDDNDDNDDDDDDGGVDAPTSLQLVSAAERDALGAYGSSKMDDYDDDY